ncbi:unnamed protein product, partial [Menidia menidia]
STGCLVIDKDGHGVDYKSADKGTKSFTFDQVVTSDDVQSLHSEVLQPLTESVSSGYNATLLICGANTETTRALTEHSIIKQVLTNLFHSFTSGRRTEFFISVSFLQFYPDGSAVDLLSLHKQTLKFVSHPVLGSLVGGLCEVCVCSAEEAWALYETCRETMNSNSVSISSRCSSLFSVAVEWKLNPEQVELDICCSRLQLFSLAGGASRTDLRGVSPLAKIWDQMPNSVATVDDSLLNFLLKDSLTGNTRTFLIYCINPQSLLHDETLCALDLAQRVRQLETSPTAGCWSPRSTERQIREGIMELQTMIMSGGESELHNIYKLAELSENLQMVKNKSWEKRMEESKKIKDQMKISKSSNSNQQFSGGHHADKRKSTETVKYLQDQLKREMEQHMRESKGRVEKVQERVARIQQLREALSEETLKSGAVTGQSQLCHQLEYSAAQERRRQLKEDHGRLIQEEVVKMERDLAQENLPPEIPQRELLVLTRERQVLVMQLEALRAEAQQAEKDLKDQYQRHQSELHCVQSVSEEQRKISEDRYRSVLLEAVQDAIYLSAQNQQLQADNTQLRKALGEMKDALAVRGDPGADTHC